jgi:hypothetical protein
MPHRTYLVFGNIEGKLDVLRVECTKCARKGRHSVRKLIEKHGQFLAVRTGTALCLPPAKAMHDSVEEPAGARQNSTRTHQ